MGSVEDSLHRGPAGDSVAWRRTVLERAHWAALLIVLFALLGAVVQQSAGERSIALRLLPGLLVLAAALACRTGPLRLRGPALIMGLGMAVAGAIFDRGFLLPNTLSGGVFLSVVSALVLGRRATWIAVAGLGVVWLAAGWFFVTGGQAPVDTYVDLSHGGNWVRVLLVYGIVIVATTGSVLFIVTRLEDALRRVRALCDAVVHESEEKLAAQRQLQQAQKMESLGRLAGGVAHDFNNLLQVIVVNAELCAEDDAECRELARRDILAAAARAKALTRQLLAFSRREPIAAGPVDVGAGATAAVGLLRRLLPDTITLTVDVPPTLPPCWGPGTAVEQILINLCLNARDAMVDGGALCVTVEAVDAAPPDPVAAHPHSGAFVRLRVRDTGSGIDEALLQHIFEPFFTTKEVGRGTGLGLSMVQALARRCGGFVEVRSVVGEGTTFDVYLAVRAGEVQAAAPSATTRAAAETRVLVVDDDEIVRRVISDALRRAQYPVFEARDGVDGLAVFEAQGPIDVVITDAVMPRMCGEVMARRMAEHDPRTAFLVCSGYTAETFGDRFFDSPRRAFISKPVRPAELVGAIERLRACRAAEGAAGSRRVSSA